MSKYVIDIQDGVEYISYNVARPGEAYTQVIRVDELNRLPDDYMGKWNGLKKKPEENEKCIVLYKDGKISGALHICGAFKADFTNFDEKLVAWRPINTREIAKAKLHAAIDGLNIEEKEFTGLRAELHKAVEEVKA